MANPGRRKEALPAFHFEVTVGQASYPFKAVSGIKSETKVFEVEEGGMNGHVHKLVGQTTFPPLVLRQGFCDPASPLCRLYLDFIKDGGRKQRFDGTIKQIGPNGTSARWTFRGGWISKWEGPELDASKNEVSIEAIEISHEGVYLVSAGGAPGASAAGGGPTGTGTGAGGGTTGGGSVSTFLDDDDGP
jgi:phage tail-like protein